MASVAPEPGNGAENTRSGQLRAKGRSPQSVTWSRSERETTRRTVPADGTILASVASTLSPRSRTNPVKSHTHVQRVAAGELVNRLR